MKNTLRAEDAPPITTTDEARERVCELVGHAIRRQLWLMPLDRHGTQLSILIPVVESRFAPSRAASPPSPPA